MKYTAGRVFGGDDGGLDNLSDKIREKVALKIYELIRKLKDSGEFPYDTYTTKKGRKRTEDTRKKWKYPWHLWSRGAVFVGNKKLKGPFYKGKFPANAKDKIEVVFSNVKEQSHRDFDYAFINLEERLHLFDHYPTDSEIRHIINEATKEVLAGLTK